MAKNKEEMDPRYVLEVHCNDPYPGSGSREDSKMIEEAIGRAAGRQSRGGRYTYGQRDRQIHLWAKSEEEAARVVVMVTPVAGVG